MKNNNDKSWEKEDFSSLLYKVTGKVYAPSDKIKEDGAADATPPSLA